MERTTSAFAAQLAAGTPVEVRSRYDASWSRGFVIAGASGQGYVLRRLSDGALLPAAFAVQDLRPAGMAGPFTR